MTANGIVASDIITILYNKTGIISIIFPTIASIYPTLLKFSGGFCEKQKGYPCSADSGAENMKYTEDGRFAYAEKLNGTYMFSFQSKETREEYKHLGYCG